MREGAARASWVSVSAAEAAVAMAVMRAVASAMQGANRVLVLMLDKAR